MHFKSIVSNLERYVKVISRLMDVARAFAGLTNGQQHCINRAVKALLIFPEVMGFDRGWLDALRKVVPRDDVGVDLKIPSEQEVIVSLRQAMRTNQETKLAYKCSVKKA